MTLADYQTNCNEEDESPVGWVYLDDALNTYKADGSFDKSYIYVPQWWADIMTDELKHEVTKGWYDATDSNYNTNLSSKKIPFGEGAIAKATGVGATITFSGAVKEAPTVTDIGVFTIAGNSAPKGIKIGQLIVNCDEDDETGSGWIYLDDAINTYTAEGGFDKSYIYVPQWWADIMTDELKRPVTKGWYDATDTNYEVNVSESKGFEAGEGFVAKATASGATITVKSALAEESK